MFKFTCLQLEKRNLGKQLWWCFLDYPVPICTNLYQPVRTCINLNQKLSKNLHQTVLFLPIKQYFDMKFGVGMAGVGTM